MNALLRETEILVTLPERLSDKEISDRLYISPGTVKKPLNSIYQAQRHTHRSHCQGQEVALHPTRPRGLAAAPVSDYPPPLKAPATTPFPESHHASSPETTYGPFYRPYDVGDFVEAAGVTGTVSDMNLVFTTILTIDNQTLIVPNGKIWGDVIRNVTAQKVRRVDLVFDISYSDDIPHAESVLMAILEENEMVLKDPEPMVKLHELADSSVNFVVRPWARTEDYWDVLWGVTREVKMRLDREGIGIPFPQRDVHLFQASSKE